MNMIIYEIEMKLRAKAAMVLKLLALSFSKPLEQYNEFPNITNCTHIDIETKSQWPDLEGELKPMLNCLAGSLVHKGKEPLDIWIVRTNGMFCIGVSY